MKQQKQPVTNDCDHESLDFTEMIISLKIFFSIIHSGTLIFDKSHYFWFFF